MKNDTHRREGATQRGPGRGAGYARFALLVAMLTAIWALLSGKFDALHFGTGFVAAIVLAVYYDDWRARRGLPLLMVALFIPWELWQIWLSNLRVAKLVMTGRKIAPALVRQPPGVSGNPALTLLGCSITLTPGTLTIDIDPDAMYVHALDDVSRREIEEEIIAAKVRAVFGEEQP